MQQVAAPAPAPAPAHLSVPDVRQALLALRQRWYEKLTPEQPFLFSAPVLESAAGDRTITFAEFGCIFDYGQHVKRHNRVFK